MSHASGRLVRTLGVVAVLVLAATACGDRSDGVSVEGSWARTSPMPARAGAAYFEISSGADDVLVGVSVDASVAAEVQIHETTMVAMDGEGGDDMAAEDGEMSGEMAGEEGEEMDGGALEGMGDVMQMREVGRIELPAGETVVLEPGGLHLMLLDLAGPLELGATFDLTLDFETAPDQVITVEVRDGAPE